MILLFSLGWAPFTLAETLKLNVKSKSDNFNIVISEGKPTVDGRDANPASLEQLLAILNDTPATACPDLPSVADITIKQGAILRDVYVAKKMVSDRKNCLTVVGEGVYALPLHRDFLIGPKTQRIEVKSPLEIYKDSNKILAFKKADKEWTCETPDILLDWDFFERFLKSLSQFNVRSRIHEQAAQGKPNLSVRVAGKSLEFFKITENDWAFKKPGTEFLLVSDDWGFWQNFDNKVIEDRYANEIRKLRKAETPTNEKMDLLGKMENAWSPNLRTLYEWQLLNETDDQIKSIALARLKRKPSPQSIPAVIGFLEKTDDEQLKRQAITILKIQNPKGPAYNPRLSEKERNQTIEFWRAWWKQNQKPK